jgi:hypothetical protein
MSQDPTHQLGIERAALGEAETKEQDRDRVEAIKTENEKFLEQHPPERVVAQIKARYQDRKRKASWMLAVPAIALTAVLFVVVRPQPEGDLEVGRSKGNVQLLVHRASSVGAEKLTDGDPARSGDRLQLGYAPGAKGYGVIASIDGSGAITIHLPKSKDDAAQALDPQGAALPFSYELDAAPRIERFFLVTSARPFAANRVEEAMRKLTNPDAEPLTLPAGFEQTSLLLRKVEP